MKIKADFELNRLSKYGFRLVLRKENKPFEILCRENPTLEGVSEEKLQEFIQNDILFDNEYFIVDSIYSNHYYNEGKYIIEIGGTRRGQYLYLLVDPETRVVLIGATKPDGDGCEIPLDDIIFKLIKDGVVERS